LALTCLTCPGKTGPPGAPLWFGGIFRTESQIRFPFLHLRRSTDGLRWEIEREKIALISEDPEAGGEGYAPSRTRRTTTPSRWLIFRRYDTAAAISPREHCP